MYKKASERFNEEIGKVGGRTFKPKLVFNDFVIEDEIKSLDFSGGSNASDTIAIGTTVSSNLKISIQKTDYLITGKEFTFYLGIVLTDKSVEYIPIGKFQAKKPSIEEYQMTFEAYDKLSYADRNYSSKYNYPCKTTDIMHEISELLGITFETNINEIILKNPNTEENASNKAFAGYTIREAIGFIAALYGKFAIINRDGNLEFKWYEKTDYKINTNKLYSFTKDENDYVIDKIIGITDNETSYSAGSGTEGIFFSNPFTNQKNVQDIYNDIGKFRYRAGELKFLGDCRLDPWDIVITEDLFGNIYEIPIMKLSHSIDGGLTTTLSAVSNPSENVENTYSGPITKAMERTHVELLLVNKLMATKITADYVEANYVATKDLDVISANIENAVIANLQGEFASFDYLETNYAKIDLANIENGCITSAMIGTGVVGTAQIADGSITDAKIIGMTANKITAGVLDAGTIDVINLNAANITVGTINGQQIAPGAVDVNNIADYAVTTEKIALGAVTANNIAAGSITGDHISANSISVDKLAVGGDFTNFITVNELIPDSAIPYISWIDNRGSEVKNGYITKIKNTDDGILLSDIKPNCFRSGDKLYYKITVKADTVSTVRVIIFFYKDKTYQAAVTSRYHEINTTDTTIEGELTIGELPDVNNYHICLRDYTMQGQVYVKNASCRRQIGSTYITDGAITTEKIVANAITGDKIAAQTITANNILAGTITAASGIISDINADIITTGTLKGITVQSINYSESTVGEPIIGSKWNMTDGSFKSKNLNWDSSGNLTGSNINFKSGHIGGWSINPDSNTIYTINNYGGTHGVNVEIGLRGAISYKLIDDWYSQWVLYSGSGTPDPDLQNYGELSPFFYIRANGEAYFSNIKCDNFLTNWETWSNGGLFTKKTFGTSTAGSTYCFWIEPVRDELGLDTKVLYGGIQAANATDKNYWTNLWYIDITGDALFGTVYADKYNTVSDKNKKHDIEELDENTCISVIKSLKPVSFKYDNTQYERKHWGFIAQDVEEELDALGISWQDYAVVDKSIHKEEFFTNITDENRKQILDEKGNPKQEPKTIETNDYDYFLRYEAFIAPLVKTVQSQQRKIDKMKNEINELKTLVYKLANKINIQE